MNTSHFIVGEWGSTFMRLHLCIREAGTVQILAHVGGHGVLGCEDFESAFFDAAQPWFNVHGPVPVILAGMIGSNIGWRDTGYAACPISSDRIEGVHFQTRGIDITIMPGLRCQNIFGLPDVVRGEEMQMFGWLDDQARAPNEQHIICLPGRHVKWVAALGHCVQSFFTGMNGEMEELLIQHSLLGRGVLQTEQLSDPDYTIGRNLMFDDPTLSVGHALFATRSRLVLRDHTPETAASFLAGVLIGGDIRDAMRAYVSRDMINGPVIVIGTTPLANLYAAELVNLGHPAQQVKDPDLAIKGLARFALASV